MVDIYPFEWRHMSANNFVVSQSKLKEGLENHHGLALPKWSQNT
jgi:hypothetical protein